LSVCYFGCKNENSEIALVFGVGATFTGDTALKNVISRVTGGNLSASIV
jgi:hypothetical protein